MCGTSDIWFCIIVYSIECTRALGNSAITFCTAVHRNLAWILSAAVLWFIAGYDPVEGIPVDFTCHRRMSLIDVLVLPCIQILAAMRDTSDHICAVRWKFMFWGYLVVFLFYASQNCTWSAKSGS